MTIDGIAREIFTRDDTAGDAPIRPTRPADRVQLGEFVSRSFTNHAGTRTYKLYVPASYSGEPGKPVPAVVMLHGCTQSPDDFAAGTRMNVLAEQHGFLVIYPAQAASANGSKCWNWFRSEDQRRDRGEPALIAGITRKVVANYHVDERRILVAGLSSGAAMAVILGTTYPDTYAAVGAHSGLPYGAAHSMASAFGAMKAPFMATATTRWTPETAPQSSSRPSATTQAKRAFSQASAKAPRREAASTATLSMPMRPISPSSSSGWCMAQVTRGREAARMDRLPTMADPTLRPR